MKARDEDGRTFDAHVCRIGCLHGPNDEVYVPEPRLDRLGVRGWIAPNKSRRVVFTRCRGAR